MSYEVLGIAMLLGAGALMSTWFLSVATKHHRRRRHINSIHEGIAQRMRERRERRES